MEKKQNYVNLTMDAVCDETDGGWRVSGTLKANGLKIDVAEVISASLKSHDKSLALMVALDILTGSPLPGKVRSKKTVIDLGAIKKGMGEG